MAPEKKYAQSSVFTVRLGFGSVILAAVITFVGLAWIFFLGVMVGRMYYGTDSFTNSQRLPVVHENTVRNPNTKDSAHQFASDSTHDKTGTTYQPVVKEDKRLEQINHKPHPFAENIEEPHYNDATSTDTSSKSVDTSREVPVNKQNMVLGINGQNADFLEKVDDKSSEKANKKHATSKQTVAPGETTSSITSHGAPHSTALLQNTGSIVPLNQDNRHSEIVIKANTGKQNTSNDATIPITSQLHDTTNHLNNTKEPRYQYTYQLATFKNAGNADATIKKLCADGLNASLLQEEKEGSIMYYILVHNTGTESAQKQLLEKFAQHHFTKFITRRSAIQE